MAPTRTTSAVLSALNSKEQSPTQPLGPDFPFSASIHSITQTDIITRTENVNADDTAADRRGETRKAVLTADGRVVEPEVASPASATATTAPTADAPSLLRRLRRSRLLAPLLEERAVKKDLVLPPPIHRLYHMLEQARHCGHEPHFPSTLTMQSPQSPSPATPVKTAVQGDVYNFTFSPREAARLRVQQRQYLRRQRASPHAPLLVHLDDLADILLEESEDYASPTSPADPSTRTTSERVSELLSVFCTRGIPQDEFIDAVFQLRLQVLQKTCKTIPVGVVVPTLVHPVVPLSDAVTTRQCRQDMRATASAAKVKGAVKVQTVHQDVVPEMRVTYPHPGRPYTFEDLARDPVYLDAEERVTRRTALLHRRTLSEDVYGTPTPYLRVSE